MNERGPQGLDQSDRTMVRGPCAPVASTAGRAAGFLGLGTTDRKASR